MSFSPLLIAGVFSHFYENPNSPLKLTTGLATVDLASNIYRCKVIALCASEDKASLVRERGAWATVTYNKQDLLREVRTVMDSEEGVPLIIDSVGGEVFSEAVKW